MRHSSEHEIVHVYVWEIPVRITHWLIALSLFVLSVTGLYIGRPFMTVPGQAGQWFVMGWMKIIHFYAAIVFIVRRDCARDLDVHRQQVRATGTSFWRCMECGGTACCQQCCSTRFFATSPPAYVGHNPVAGSAYLLVFGLYFLAIGTGLVMCGAERRRRLTASLVRAAGAALRRLSDRAVDSPRRDVAPARLHRAPRLQRHPGGGHREERHDRLDLLRLQVGAPTRAGARALPLATSRGDR